MPEIEYITPIVLLRCGNNLASAERLLVTTEWKFLTPERKMNSKEAVAKWKNVCGMTTHCDVVKISLAMEEEITLLRERVHTMKQEITSLEKEVKGYRAKEELYKQNDYVIDYYASPENWNFRTYNEVKEEESHASRINKDDCEYLPDRKLVFGGKLARKYQQIRKNFERGI